jgi:hypothetical protein
MISQYALLDANNTHIVGPPSVASTVSVFQALKVIKRLARLEDGAGHRFSAIPAIDSIENGKKQYPAAIR